MNAALVNRLHTVRRQEGQRPEYLVYERKLAIETVVEKLNKVAAF